MENGGGGEHRPWMYDEETTDIYRAFVQEHYKLIPYFMTTGKQSQNFDYALLTTLCVKEWMHLTATAL